MVARVKTDATLDIFSAAAFMGNKDYEDRMVSRYQKHVCLIDGSSVFHRAWSVRNRNEPASVLFTKMLRNLFQRMESGRIPPTHAAIFFDPPYELNWRRQAYAQYKMNRSEKPKEFNDELALSHEVCEKSGLMVGQCPTHEADDMMGAMALDAREAGAVVSILSSDKDMCQIVREGIMIHNPMTKAWLNSRAVTEKFGVTPSELCDYLALTGDAADGVPGAAGVGPKIALELMNEFGNITEILRNAHLVPRQAIRRSLEQNADIIRLSRRLVELDTQHCPRPFDIMTARFPGSAAVSALLGRVNQNDGPEIAF